MTKEEAYREVFGDEPVHVEGLELNGEVDEKFMCELEIIKQMVETMEKQNEWGICKQKEQYQNRNNARSKKEEQSTLHI